MLKFILFVSKKDLKTSLVNQTNSADIYLLKVNNRNTKKR